MQLIVSEVLMVHENKELFPSDDSYEISTGNNDTMKRTTLVLVRIPIINQLIWAEVAKKD